MDRSQVTCLALSDKIDEQVDQLLKCDFKFLTYLILDSVGVFTIHNIISQTILFNHLESLTIRFRHDQCHEKLYDLTMKILDTCSLHMKSLTYLKLCSDSEIDLSYEIERYISHPCTLQQNLPCKFLHLTAVNLHFLSKLLPHISSVESLTFIAILEPFITNYPSLPHLTSCTATFIRPDFNSLNKFLLSCQNLQQLSLVLIPVDTDVIDDREWQDLIEHNLPQLKKFFLRMATHPLEESDVERLCTSSFQVDPFWRKKNTTVTVVKTDILSDETVKVEIEIQFG